MYSQKSLLLRRRGRLILGGATLLVGSGLVLAGPAQAAPGCRLPGGPITTADLPSGSSVIECDAVGRTVVNDDALGVVVPEPGETVQLSVYSSSDSTARNALRSGTFQVQVTTDGVISYSEPPAEAESPASAKSELTAAALNECDDTTYELEGFSEHGTYEWHLNPANAAAGMSADSAKTAVVTSINHMKNTVNNCGYADTVDAASEYQGIVSNRANFNSSGCGNRDGQSVWDFGGTLPPTEEVAATCSWSAAGDLLEADVRFNTNDYNFTTDGTSSSCNDSKYDVMSVATHEAGHVFGLYDLYGDNELNLTMFYRSDTCSNKRRTLGAGDVLGMRALYS